MVPAHDGRQPHRGPFGPGGHGRAPTIDYLAQIARAADQLGYAGVLTPTGTWCEDAWLVTAALLRETERLKFLVAFRPGSLSPTLAAQKAATFQRISGGRLLLNVVTGGDPSEQRRFGDWLDHDERYDRTDDFLSVLRGAWGDEPYDFDGRLLQGRRRDDRQAGDAGAAVLRRGIGRRRARGCQARRRLPGVGRAARHGGAATRQGS